MDLGEKGAVEETDTRNPEWQQVLLLPRQKLLGNTAPVVMNQKVHGRQTQTLNPALKQIRLVFNAVIVIGGFIGKAKAQHVQGQHVVLLNQHRPESIPVPAGSGKSMDQHQRFSRACHPAEDGMSPETEPLTSMLPPF